MTDLDSNPSRRMPPGCWWLLACLLALWMPALRAQGRVMVIWAEEVATPPTPALLEELGAASGLELTWLREISGHISLLAWRGAEPLDTAEVVVRLTADPRVKAAQPDARRRLQFVPADTLYADQWYLFEAAGIRAPAAWDLQRGASAVVVAVLDTGILPHEDIDPARVLPGYDFYDRDDDPTDPGDAVTANECGDGTYREASTWHGLHVSGVFVATADNTLGIAGVDHRARLLPVRVAGQCGAWTSDIFDAMRWAVGLSVAGVAANPFPADVINLSLTYDAPCNAFDQGIIDEVIARGAAVVVAAGNERQDVANVSPASCNGVITVAAVNRAGALASYSNFGTEVDIAAPGGQVSGILTTTNLGTTSPGGDGYTDLYVGTSFSAPLASAVLALMIADQPAATVSQLREALRAGASPFPDSSCNTSLCGAGLLNAERAILALRALPEPAASGGGGGGGCALGRESRPEALWWLGLAWVLYRLARRNDPGRRRV